MYPAVPVFWICLSLAREDEVAPGIEAVVMVVFCFRGFCNISGGSFTLCCSRLDAVWRHGGIHKVDAGRDDILLTASIT